ncbi:hypothetical protein COT75_02260 [Candidatus Beckwithbacteria bacterium CG10_big_fil_rev_8_21_14_0_10_34_10]|uniref:Uncharacterized protein n=1 Tax=Candidatus Beckwithbacteria bacterium CG10_big_fil_rev_8_21_14_0_10_34_10 TaxID=1974495 RepID=A0A2H0W9K4_9BACT|nr:MAG: hypothetical protein COT75_02260 [Candidatus Beckwithbacteria bacterium CG10_big_fil_rev_8_21_14_0_10_34_10]
MKKNKDKGKGLLNLVVLTTLAFLTWVGFDIYRSSKKSSIPADIKKQIEPLDPNFDLKTLESLKERKQIKEKDLQSVPEITEFEFEEETATAETEVDNVSKKEISEKEN